MALTPEPKPAGKGNLDLAKYAMSLRVALWQANQDKMALRVWLLEQLKPSLNPDRIDD